MIQKKVVAIHDISCYGRCSLTVALPILSAAGINTPIIPTAVLSTFVGPFPGFTYRDMTDDIIPVIEHWNDMGFEFDAVYTGFLGSKEQVDVVRKAIQMLKGSDTKVFVDPVMGDAGKLYSTFDEDFPSEMRKLCGDADIIIPNITEATMMLGEPYVKGPYTKEYISGLLERTAALGADKVVLTSVYFDDKELGTATYDCLTGEVRYIMKERFPGLYHGSGDIFGSGLVSSLVNGWSLAESVDIAEDFTISSIRYSVDNGHDTDHGLSFEDSLSEFSSRVKAVKGHRRIDSKEDIEKVSMMAREIWTEAFIDIISKEQIDYMLDKFLSPDAISGSISEGLVYEFITERGEDAGFVAYGKEGDRLFLSKLYVLKKHRGKGLAKYSMRHIIRKAVDSGIGIVYLTVHRSNVSAVSKYKDWGFVAVEDSDFEIGNGFYMNDHIMELDISKCGDRI